MNATLTTNDLVELRTRASDATPGPWRYGQATEEPMTREQRADWLSSALRDGDHHIWTAWVQGDGEVIVPAVNGDGPNAEKNARFVSAANPATITALLDHIVALEAERDAAQAALCRVESLHSRGSFGRCDGCMEVAAGAIDDPEWPCATIRALSGDEQAADA